MSARDKIVAREEEAIQEHGTENMEISEMELDLEISPQEEISNESVSIDVELQLEESDTGIDCKPDSSEKTIEETSENIDKIVVENRGEESFLQVGSKVAVLCKVEDDGQTEEWMLASILAFKPDDQMYEVADCDLDPSDTPIFGNGPASKRRLVPLSKIVRLPQTEDEALGVEEAKSKCHVLALFPGTTCLYPAQVISGPSRRKKTRDYLLRFHDDEEPSRTCPAQYVLVSPPTIL